MTPYAIADHQGSHLTKEETEWPVFNDRQEYCGQIYLIAAWAVPEKVHQQLGLPSHIDIYLTSEGHWVLTREQAEHCLLSPNPLEILRIVFKH